MQHALLKIMEGYPAKIEQRLSTSTPPTFYSSAAARSSAWMRSCRKTHGYGFISTSNDDNQNILDRLNTRVKPTDLFEYGLIPGIHRTAADHRELPEPDANDAGAHHDRAEELDLQPVPRNISETKASTSKIEPRVFEQISEIAMEYKTGARSLRGIFEELINPVLYVVPDNRDINKVVITSLFTEPQIFKSSAAA